MGKSFFVGAVGFKLEAVKPWSSLRPRRFILRARHIPRQLTWQLGSQLQAQKQLYTTEELVTSPSGLDSITSIISQGA